MQINSQRIQQIKKPTSLRLIGFHSSDLRQIYAYNKFWDSNKAMLLYPGDQLDSNFIPFEDYTGEYDKHYCKLGFVHVLEGGQLDMDIGYKILEKLEEDSMSVITKS